jgi:hypothetical protein
MSLVCRFTKDDTLREIVSIVSLPLSKPSPVRPVHLEYREFIPYPPRREEFLIPLGMLCNLCGDADRVGRIRTAADKFFVILSLEFLATGRQRCSRPISLKG